ncbi:MAG: glutamine--tRNA ligase/YqeY domain fusion protein [Desulfohalobiaceae bacterium]
MSHKEESKGSSNFIRNIIRQDLESGKHDQVVTRFPPEPNGYLHIGHAKSICLNFGMAWEFGGRCHLRFDDTNPLKESEEYVCSIKQDVRWLGYDWGQYLHFASDYFEQLYEFALHLVREGKAFVCSLSPEEIRAYRGTLTQPGKNSPYRERSVEENLELLEGMRSGKYAEGEHVLRAKIDMAAPNINMRDPVIYRIMHARHHRTGDKWCIYPTYDFAHGLSDAIEGVTHSLCSMEFEDHRPLYDWFVDNVPVPARPRQYEFARLNMGYTVLSKRKLIQLVQQGYVQGWDDPRMPTICGMRRRGVSPASLRNFCEMIGVGRSDNLVDMSMLEHAVREDLNRNSPRVMGVLDPLKVVIINYPAEQEEELEALNNPEDPAAGSRGVPFSREIYIEREDFREEPPKKFYRLAPGREVRLRYAYYITCEEVIKDQTGNIQELHCTYDPETKGGDSPDGRKVKSTLHWVSAAHCFRAEVRLYDRLFTKPDPAAEDRKTGDFKSCLNPDSLQVLNNCPVEPSLAQIRPGERVQFERKGYFCLDPDSSQDRLIFNRTVALRDTWAKIEAREKGQS